ncbi:MAG: hypothetical protein M1269_11260 [Chloroflexi bacterium]|nr:hypothetical protein [Chloroflexota bacterium]
MNRKRKYFKVLFCIILLLISVALFIGYRQFEEITSSNSIERLRVCRGHMRKILGAMQLYCLDHEGRLPPATKADDKYYWVEALAPYIEKLWTISKQNFEQVRQQDKNHYA